MLGAGFSYQRDSNPNDNCLFYDRRYCEIFGTCFAWNEM